MNNLEIIRQMDDNQLADFLCRLMGDFGDCDNCVAYEYCRIYHNGMMSWLKHTEDDFMKEYINEDQKYY